MEAEGASEQDKWRGIKNDSEEWRSTISSRASLSSWIAINGLVFNPGLVPAGIYENAAYNEWLSRTSLVFRLRINQISFQCSRNQLGLKIIIIIRWRYTPAHTTHFPHQKTQPLWFPRWLHSLTSCKRQWKRWLCLQYGTTTVSFVLKNGPTPTHRPLKDFAQCSLGYTICWSTKEMIITRLLKSCNCSIYK